MVRRRVPAVLHGLDPGGVRPDPRGSGGHRRQDGTAFPRPQCGQAGHPPGQRLGSSANTLTLGQVKTAEKSNEITSRCLLHRRPAAVAANAGTEGVHRPTIDALHGAARCRGDRPGGFWTGEPAGTCWQREGEPRSTGSVKDVRDLSSVEGSADVSLRVQQFRGECPMTRRHPPVNKDHGRYRTSGVLPSTGQSATHLAWST